MANSRSSGANKEYATVDTRPTSAGYFTNEVDVRLLSKNDKVKKLFFSIRETAADISAAPSALSTITVVLQFRCPGDAAWTDYVDLAGSSLAIGNRLIIEDGGAGVFWRAGVRDDEYTSGSVTFGFDW
jgi:hypothetical protein